MFTKLLFENTSAGSGSINFSAGLTVLEKGKENARPEIMNAIAVLAGKTAGGTALAQPAVPCSISGEFQNPAENVWQIAQSLGCKRADTLIVTREIAANGNVTSIVNGVTVSGTQADVICDSLFEVYGMGMQNSIMDSSKHADILDRVAKNHDKIGAYKNAFRELAKSRKMIALLSADEKERNQQIEVLRNETEEIEGANLRVGELEKLSSIIHLLRNEQEILASLNIIAELANEKSGVINAVATASQEAESLAGKTGKQYYQIQNIANALKNQLQALKLTSAYAKEQINSISEETAGQNLKETEERYNIISALAEKYGGSVDAAIEHAEQAWVQLTDVEFGSEHLEKLQKNEGMLLLNVSDAADELTKSRLDGFATLSGLLAKVIATLGMPDFKIHLKHEIVAPGAKGRDKIAMLMSKDDGEQKSAESFATISNPEFAGLTSIGAVLTTVDMPTVFYSDVEGNLNDNAAAAMSNLIKMSAANQQIICVAASGHFIDKADSLL